MNCPMSERPAPEDVPARVHQRLGDGRPYFMAPCVGGCGFVVALDKFGDYEVHPARALIDKQREGQ